MRRPVYKTRYGYPLRVALVAEFWWRVEHFGDYQGGGMGSRARRYAYAQRKAWERRGAQAVATTHLSDSDTKEPRA